MGLNGDLIEQILDHPHRYILTRDNVAELLKTSFSRRYQIDITFTKVQSFPYGTLFRISSGKTKNVKVCGISMECS
jgi:hypothetical protein